EDLVRRIAAIPGATDVRLQQVPRYPEFDVDVDRWMARQVGFTESNVAQSLLVSLSGTAQAQPNFWLNVQTGVNYPVVVQTPQYRVDSVDALGNTSIALPGQPRPQLLTNLASLRRNVAPGVISHYNVQPVFDVLAAVNRADLWSVSSAVTSIVDEVRPTLPRGTFITIRGQADTIRASFTALAMILGMLPMSLGLGEGGEQNAPLGRVVIGGLLLATFATLVFVPVVYSVLRRNQGGLEVPEELRE